MAWKKFKANKIFTGYEILGENKVLITDDAGIIEEIVDENEAGEKVQICTGILSPGFINCHCHLELSHLKGAIPEKTGLVDFVLNILQQRHSSQEKILEAINKAEEEMLKNGIVAVGDICNTADTILQKAKARLKYHNFIEVSGFIPEFAFKRFEQAIELYDRFATQPSVENTQSLIPHAPYSVSKELFQLINEFSQGKISTIHNQESIEEDKLFKTGKSDFDRLYKQLNIDTSFFKSSGKSSLQTFFEWMKEASQILLVHNTFIKEEDIEAIRSDMRTYFCLCPNANLHIEDKLPPVDLLRKHQSNIVLGTDSLASNNSLDILSEIRTITNHFPSVSPLEILQWATINGARSLNLDNNLGSFEKGKKPGVICFNETFSGTVDCLI